VLLVMPPQREHRYSYATRKEQSGTRAKAVGARPVSDNRGRANATLGVAAPLPLRSSGPVDWGDSPT